MSYDNDNKGAIWKNQKREKESHPHFTGSAMINGIEYWVSAWKRGDDSAEKAPALKFSFQQKERETKQPAAHKNMVELSFDDDEIPF